MDIPSDCAPGTDVVVLNSARRPEEIIFREELEQFTEARGTSEEMFLAWFLNLPDDANVAETARIEIARIDGAAAPCAQVVRLRSLLYQATLNQPAAPRHRRRQRH
jgi:ferredoxin-NADP reductase